jgi:hypothetical protein
MLTRLFKTYTISVTIQEGNDEFWDDLRHKSGGDEVVAEVRRCLAEHGFIEPSCYVSLEKFGNQPPQCFVRPQAEQINK